MVKRENLYISSLPAYFGNSFKSNNYYHESKTEKIRIKLIDSTNSINEIDADDAYFISK